MIVVVARLALATLLVLFVLDAGWRPKVAGRAGDEHVDRAGGEGEHWHDLLEQAAEAGRQRAYQGRLVVVRFDEQGPTLGEVSVTQGSDGTLRTDNAQRWMLGRVNGEAFFGDPDSGTLLWLGNVERTGFSLARLSQNYEVAVEDRRSIETGPADVITLREPGSALPRERLYVDAESRLVVRRETFDARGLPVRLAAFTDLELVPAPVPPLGYDWRHVLRPVQSDLSGRAVEILRDVGWVVPERLPRHFTLVDASAIGQGEGSSLHLLYSDGLYMLSVYEQHGRLDEKALDAEGAEDTSLGGLRLYRWPGSEPAAYGWNGEDIAFTAISDAPPDVLAVTLVGLPRDDPSLLRRLRRGLSRFREWAWPFD
ncbi:MAG: hypothetical protein M3133_02510 [Actinomycetota bacterium]|nr:hypothetical protein [Actinomycetota bacterium]